MRALHLRDYEEMAQRRRSAALLAYRRFNRFCEGEALRFVVGMGDKQREETLKPSMSDEETRDLYARLTEVLGVGGLPGNVDPWVLRGLREGSVFIAQDIDGAIHMRFKQIKDAKET